MKKTLLVMAAGMMAISGLAQGTITFANGASSLVNIDNGTTVAAAAASDSPRVALYYSTAASAPAIDPMTGLFAGWTLTTGGLGNVGVPVAGRFSSGTRTAETATGGSSIWVFVAGWSGGYADYATALQNNAFTGVTTAWSQATGAPNGTPPTAAVPMTLGATGFNGLTLAGSIPEPGTLALAGLGAASLLLLRRRK